MTYTERLYQFARKNYAHQDFYPPRLDEAMGSDGRGHTEAMQACCNMLRDPIKYPGLSRVRQGIYHIDTALVPPSTFAPRGEFDPILVNFESMDHYIDIAGTWYRYLVKDLSRVHGNDTCGNCGRIVALGDKVVVGMSKGRTVVRVCGDDRDDSCHGYRYLKTRMRIRGDAW